MQHAGVSLRGLARELSDELGTRVTPSTLVSWRDRRSTPRGVSINEVLDALRAIAMRHEPAPYPGRTMEKTVVQATFQQWCDQLGRPRVKEILGISRQRLSAYVTGRYSVDTRTFAEFEKTMAPHLRA